MCSYRNCAAAALSCNHHRRVREGRGQTVALRQAGFSRHGVAIRGNVGTQDPERARGVAGTSGAGRPPERSLV
jgi:hypothetical protein